MSLNEMLAAIPTLSFAERQLVIRQAMEADEELTPEEIAILDARLKEFRPGSGGGIPAESLKAEVLQRLRPR